MKEWLKSLRYEKRMTQQDVAYRAAISRQFYNFIENGQHKPSPKVALLIVTTILSKMDSVGHHLR